MRNRNGSSHGYLFDFGSMDVVDFFLVLDFLDDWLSDDLFSWNLYNLFSGYSLNLRIFDSWFHDDGLVRLSVELDINTFSLDDWLDVSLLDDFFAWSGDSFSSESVLFDGFSSDGFSLDDSGFRLNEFDFLFVVDDGLLDDWLGDNFFGRSLEVFEDSLY